MYSFKIVDLLLSSAYNLVSTDGGSKMQIFPQTAATQNLDSLSVIHKMRPGDAVAVFDSELVTRPYLVTEILMLGATVGRQLSVYRHAATEGVEAGYEIFCVAMAPGASRSTTPVRLRSPATTDQYFFMQLDAVLTLLEKFVASDGNILAAYGQNDDDAANDVIAYTAISRRVLSLKGFKHSPENPTTALNKCVDYLQAQGVLVPNPLSGKAKGRGYRIQGGALTRLQVDLLKRQDATINTPTTEETNSED